VVDCVELRKWGSFSAFSFIMCNCFAMLLTFCVSDSNDSNDDGDDDDDDGDANDCLQCAISLHAFSQFST